MASKKYYALLYGEEDDEDEETNSRWTLKFKQSLFSCYECRNFRVVLVLYIIFRWANELMDVKGMFLCGNFQHENPIYMKAPKEFDQDYIADVLMLLRWRIYGLKQASREFCWELRAALKDMRYSHSLAYPCLYLSWTMTGLIIWMTWIADSLIAVDKKGSK